MTDRTSNEYVGIDYGKSGGDMTGITARCPKCQRIYSMTFEPGAIVLMPVELQCACGAVTDLRATDELGSCAKHPWAKFIASHGCPTCHLEGSSVETNGVDPNYKLPCDVRLPLAMSISKGCPLSTLMNAFRFREGWSEEDTHFQDERAKAVRRSITELLNDRDRLNAEMAGRVLGDPRESVEIGGKGPTIWQNSDSSEKSNEQPSAPAVVRPTLSEPPSLGSAAGVDLTISRPPQ